MKKMVKPKNVDAYIASFPEAVQGKLNELRAAIKQVAPKAEESISYGIPYYSYFGRLVYFGAYKTHIGLYLPSPVLEDHKDELEGYQITKATLRLPIDKKLPISLIKKLVKARVKINEAKK